MIKKKGENYMNMLPVNAEWNRRNKWTDKQRLVQQAREKSLLLLRVRKSLVINRTPKEV